MADRSDHSARAALIGRNLELDIVLRAVEEAGQAFVAGEAGVGKSTFLGAVSAALTSNGYAVFTVSATAALDDYPFAALSHLVEGVGDADPSAVLANAVAALATLAPGSSAVLLIDDAHLLDRWSLHAAIQARASGRLRVVAFARPAEGSAHAVSTFGRMPGVRVDLQRLSRAESAELAASTLGAPLDTASADQLFAASDGLPLAVDQLVRYAQSCGALALVAGLWRWDRAGLDQHLAELLGLRVDRLGPGQRDALDLLSVVEHLPLELAGQLCPAADFAEMEDQGLVRVSVRPGWLAPGHALLRDACLARLAPIRRRSLLTRFVEHLAQHPHGDAEIARWRITLAVEVDAPVATGDLLALVRWASTNGAASIGLGVLQRAWEVQPDAFTGVSYAEGLYASADMQAADRVLREATRLCTTDDERLRVALAHAHTLRAGLRDVAAGTRVLDQARKSLTEPALQLEIAATDAANLLMQGRVSDVIALAELARQVDDGGSGSHSAHYRLAQATVPAYGFSGRLVEADGEYQRHVALRPLVANQHGRSAVIVDTWWAACNVLAGRARLVERLIDDSYAEALANDSSIVRMVWALPAAMDRWLRGELVDAELYAREAMVAPPFLGGVRQIAGYLLARISHLKGDHRAALQLCDDAVDNPAVGIDTTWFASARAVSIAELGAGTTARRDALAAAAETGALGQAVTASYLYHDVVRLGGAREAEAPLAELMNGCQAPSVRWMALHARGVARQDPGSLIELAAEADAERYTTLSIAFLADAARIARERRNALVASRALDALDEHLARCQAFAHPLAGAVTELGLSSRELEVARAAAAGMADAEIAARLVLSVRTVNAHLRSVYRKLGVSGRRELRHVATLTR